MPTCAHCSAAFNIDQGDLAFLDRVSPVINGQKHLITPPTLCPECRQQRRLSYRDEKYLYKRPSDYSGRQIITIYSPDKPFKVYESDIWWSDKWDALDYGHSFDFNRSLFEQFKTLSLQVPRLQYTAYNNEDCPFLNRGSNCRRCYMCFNLDHGEDSYYCEVGYKTKDCLDCGFSKEMERCINCLDCVKSYNSVALDSCSNISDSACCYDCHNGSNLILCWNLRNKNYCIKNIQYSPEEFLSKKTSLGLDSFKNSQKINQIFIDLKQAEAIHKYSNQIGCENCTGDHLFYCKNCHNCYDTLRGEDLKNVYAVDNIARDSMDSAVIWDGAELNYECMSTNRYHILFSVNVWESSDVFYSQLCKSCSYCFGCFGLKNKQFCILNKQYSEQEYFTLLEQIIGHLQSTNEWGEFFPVVLSDFAYNESLAIEYYPLNKEQALKNGWQWKDDLPGTRGKQTVSWNQVQDSIKDTQESITEEILECQRCGVNYRIIPQELNLLKQLSAPLPRLCPECRHQERISKRNPRRLWNRKCSYCGKEIASTYSDDRKEKVFCEDCYLKAVY